MDLIPSVADARNRARASILKARQGVHPVHERKQQSAVEKAEAAAKAFTFAKLAERYVTEYAVVNTEATSASETARLLKRASAFFEDNPVREITKSDILDLIAQRKQNHFGTPGLVEANHRLAAVRRCWRWAVNQDLVDTDSTIGVMKPLRKVEGRDHVLTDDEIVMFWHGTEKLGWPFGGYRVLLEMGEPSCSPLEARARSGALVIPRSVWIS
jgi:integrase